MQMKFASCIKTEIVIFKSKPKRFEDDLKIKLCGKRLYPTGSIKYVSVKIDINPSSQYHLNYFFIKLNRAIAVLLKIENRF